MAKTKTTFECSACGHREPKWTGRCPQCGEWNSFLEVPQNAGTGTGGAGRGRSAGKDRREEIFSQPLASVDSGESVRFESAIQELNRVLGGGIMKASSILVGGEPGIGKSTLMLQAADSFPPPGKILYVSGEESAGQLKLRADRLGIRRDMEVLCQPELETVLSVLDRVKPLLVILDSIQTLYSPEAGAVPGTPNQLRYCCHELIEWTRNHGAALFLVAHITKEGLIAGPKIIEHMVDTVLYFDNSRTDIRFLRATKNRFGSVDEIGLFTMTEKGLAEVTDPASLFLVQRTGELPPGIATVPVYEGSRVLLMEIQALTVPAQGGISRTSSDRIDPRRVSRIAAVLEKHLGLRFSDQDLYINVAGGMNLKETGIDLAIALALYSARTGLPLPAHTAAAGEISLAGEIRRIPHMDKRIKTSAEMGFSRIIGPPRESGPGEKGHSSAGAPAGGRNDGYTGVSALKDAAARVFGTNRN